MNRTRLTSLLAATALVATVPIAAQGVDLSIESNAFVERVDAGTLTLATDGGDTLTLTYKDAAGATVGRPESVRLGNRAKCLVPLGEFTFLDIAVSAGDVGLVSNGLGSRESNNCASGNGRLSVGQTLTLTLGDGLPANVRVDDAVLDLEGKFGADARVVTRRGTTVAGDVVIDLDGDATDNGADAGEADNTYAAIGVAGDSSDDFTTLELAVEDLDDDGRDELALEGGGDWNAPDDHRTVFNLVALTGYEYALDCGDTVTSDGDADFGDAVSGASGYSLTRYGDADATGEVDSCDPIGADLSSDGDGVLFSKTTADAEGDEQDPTTRLTLVWRVELLEADGTPRSTADVEDELAREIDLLDGNGAKAVQYCLANNDDPDTGALAPATKPGPDVPWCLLDETVTVVDGHLVQVQVYDGSGDPTWI